MRKMTINNKEITTNYGESGADVIVSGDDLPNYHLRVKTNCFESDREMLERLVSYGYTRIRFARVTTMVRGSYNTIAYVR